MHRHPKVPGHTIKGKKLIIQVIRLCIAINKSIRRLYFCLIDHESTMEDPSLMLSGGCARRSPKIGSSRIAVKQAWSSAKYSAFMRKTVVGAAPAPTDPAGDPSVGVAAAVLRVFFVRGVTAPEPHEPRLFAIMGV